MANIGWPAAVAGNASEPVGPGYAAALAKVRRAVAEGARMIDLGGADDSGVAAVRACEPDVIVCADAPGADMTRDAAIAARSGAALLLPRPPAGGGSCHPGGTAVITAALADAAPLAAAGWPVLVDVDADEIAASVAVAAVCVWLGVTILRTSRVTAVRQAADMVEAIRGARAPFWTRRGLA